MPDPSDWMYWKRHCAKLTNEELAQKLAELSRNSPSIRELHRAALLLEASNRLRQIDSTS